MIGEKETGAVKPPAEPAFASRREPQAYAGRVIVEVLVAILALSLSGCDWLRNHPEVIPHNPCTDCLVLPVAEDVSRCLLACTAPRATPTPAITAVIVPTATVTHTEAPAIETAVPVGGDLCTGPDGSWGPFGVQVEKAEREWLDAHTDRWTHAGLGGTEFRLGGAAVGDGFQFDVVRALRAADLDAVVEANGSGAPNGSIVVAPRGDASFHAGYALVVGGSWDVRFPSRGGGYRGRCEPRGFATNPTPVLPQNEPTATATPAAPRAVETATPTPTMVPMPPTIDRFNGCSDGSGHCEFALWFKLEVPADRPQPCRPDQCPDLWHPAGMALTCDHMFTNAGAPGGTYEPRAGRWVSIMWYVCGSRVWDDPRGPELRITYPGHCDQPGFRGGVHGDLFNATCFGPGEVTVCARADAYACADPADYLDHDVTYNPVHPGCAHGTVPMPGAGACVGPFAVRN